jgi:hypothetical protein
MRTSVNEKEGVSITKGRIFAYALLFHKQWQLCEHEIAMLDLSVILKFPKTFPDI